MAKTTKGKFDLVDANETAYSQLVTEANANWQKAENELEGLETNIAEVEDALGELETNVSLLNEQGDWQPSIRGSSTAGTATYTQRTGRYVKVGKLVFLYARITATSVSGGSGFYQVGGLPFPPAYDGQYINSPSTIAGTGNLADVTSGFIFLRDARGTGAVTYQAISGNTYIYITGCYECA